LIGDKYEAGVCNEIKYCGIHGIITRIGLRASEKLSSLIKESMEAALLSKVSQEEVGAFYLLFFLYDK
jgi:hypothetical protein